MKAAGRERAARVGAALRLGVVIFLAAGGAGCGVELFGNPPRVETHGFRAVLTVTKNGVETERFQIAARGPDRLREPVVGAGPALLVRTAEKKAWEFDRSAKTWAEVDFEAALARLTTHPFSPRFSEAAEAYRRGLKEYSRESDAVHAGNACQLWRFADDPAKELSPTTTYWSAPALDSLVVRVDRIDPASGSRLVTELTSVQAGAAPSSFVLPTGYSKRP